MKEHSAIPGILQYINSFEQRVEEADTGREMFRKVVILELMEGSLAEAVSNWKDLGCAGKPSHLHAIQFVSASLLHTLAAELWRKERPGPSRCEAGHSPAKPSFAIVQITRCLIGSCSRPQKMLLFFLHLSGQARTTS